MKKFDHAFDVAFSVISTNKVTDVTAAELLAGIKARVAYFEKNTEELVEACGAAFDSFETEK